MLDLNFFSRPVLDICFMATLETYVVRSTGLQFIRRLCLKLSYYQQLLPIKLDLTFFLQLF